MPFGMYMSAEGALAQTQRLEVIANNLANVNTVGFKPDVTGFQARLAEAIQQGSATHGDRSNSDVGGGVSVIDVSTNYSAGRLQETGNKLDMAIIGDGFFQVDDGNGEQLLTRAGNFSLDNQNRLVSTNGMPVLDASGGEITLAPDVPWDLSATGEIRQGGAKLRLGLVTPESLGDLVK
ncbi:MAG: flagellar hook-basal body protein, partial [Aeoliella sp.]